MRMAKNKSKKGNKGDKKSKTPKIERNWEELGLMMTKSVDREVADNEQ